MTLEEIKNAVDEGRTVHWATPGYTVVKDDLGQYLIKCRSNGSCIGLTWQDGTTLNAKPDSFYIEEEAARSRRLTRAASWGR